MGGPWPTLEAQLTALTQEFVARLVDALRNASFAEVAQLSRRPSRRAARRRPRRVLPAPARPPAAGRGGTADRGRRAPSSARRVVGALGRAGQPMGVRALSSELGVAPDVLAVPLRELRAAGKVRKHGEKRSTTYSARLTSTYDHR